MRFGLDRRTVVLGFLALILAVVLGAVAGAVVGVGAGVLAALAGLVPPAVLAVAVERRQRTAEQINRQREILRKFAPPKATGEEEKR